MCGNNRHLHKAPLIVLPAGLQGATTADRRRGVGKACEGRRTWILDLNVVVERFRVSATAFSISHSIFVCFGVPFGAIVRRHEVVFRSGRYVKATPRSIRGGQFLGIL
jgi:hypothetical protein